MTNPSDHLGLIDYAVIEFVDNTIDDAVTASIVDLVASGTVRILDLAVIRKDSDGTVTVDEYQEVEELSSLHALGDFVAHVVAAEDLIVTAEVLAPGATALLVVWENIWTLELAHAIRRSGGQMVATGRIPTDEIIAALEAASN